MNKKYLKKLCCGAGLILGMSSIAFAENLYYDNDVVAPWGRLQIIGATEVNNVNYVDRAKVQVQIFAADNMCADNEIKYYISTSPISNTEKITAWEDYETNKVIEMTLPNLSGTNTLYLALKDANGNTSIIYDSSVSQTVTYDVNATDATMPTGLATTRVHGAPFVVTSQTPTREGYYFLGWSTDKNATTPSYRQGDIIPAAVQIGTETSATLYAVWTTSLGALPQLSEVVEIGDYVNYPVYYDNVSSNGGSSYIAKRRGWRVLSKDVDIDGNPAPGTVNLVSAGVPLTYRHYSYPTTSIKNLAINFLTTAFSSSDDNTYRTTGFNPFQTLTEVFTNKYTATYTQDTTVTYTSTQYSGATTTVTGEKKAGTLKVRAMTKEDLDKVYDPTGNTTTKSGTSVTAAKYQDLLAVPATNSGNYAYYWLASAYNSRDLWCVDSSGYVYSNSYYANGVRPVVSLKSEVLAEGTDMIGAWNINME